MKKTMFKVKVTHIAITTRQLYGIPRDCRNNTRHKDEVETPLHKTTRKYQLVDNRKNLPISLLLILLSIEMFDLSIFTVFYRYSLTS